MNERLAERSDKWTFRDAASKPLRHKGFVTFGSDVAESQHIPHNDKGGCEGEGVPGKCAVFEGFVIDELQSCHATRDKLLRTDVLSYGE